MTKDECPIRFVGAGPGDPELITVKGQKALMEADVVIYAGSLVPKALLKWTRDHATVLSSASMHLEEIIDTMSKAFAEGNAETIKKTYSEYHKSAAAYLDHCAVHEEFDFVYEASLLHDEEYANWEKSAK